MRKTSCLELFDLIGPKQGLYVNNNSIHKSSLGGIFTIFIFIISALSFVGFGYDIFEKRKPEIFSSKELNYTNTIQIKKTLFAFAPMLMGGAKIPDFERRIIPYMEYIVTKSNRTDFIPLPLLKCKDTEAFKENFYDINSNVIGDLDDYYCLTENFTEPIIGKYGNQHFTSYEFGF
jgi:hypothetical protein